MGQTIKKRNGKIEFLRFLFAVIIVLHHSRYLVGDEKCIFLGGSLAVEFFFIVSGYLMMATIEKKRLTNSSVLMLGNETLQFILKKVKSVYPDVLIAWIIACVFISYVKDNSFFEVILLFFNSFFEVTLLKMSGLPAIAVNGVTWYISSMLLCMVILYPLIRRYHDMMVYVGLPLIVLLTMGYLCGEYGEPRNPTKWIGFTYKGNLRALAEISLGAICFQLVSKGSNISFSRLGRITMSLLENSLYVLVILYMYYCKAGIQDYLVLLMIAVAVSLSFMAKSIDAEFFNCKVCYWLGKFSFPLYLGHTYYAQYLNLILPGNFTNGQRMIVYVLCAIVTACTIWWISKEIKKLVPKISRNITNLFLEKV